MSRKRVSWIGCGLGGCVWVLPGLVGCSNPQGGPQPEDHVIAETPVGPDQAVEGRLTLEQPIDLIATTTVLVPVSIGVRSKDSAKEDGFGARLPLAESRATADSWRGDGSYGRVADRHVRWHNAVFVDTTTGNQWTLLQERGVVSSWRQYGQPAMTDSRGVQIPARPGLQVFEVTTKDGDGDGRLTDQDPLVVMVTKPDGREPQVVSPPDAQVWGVRWDAADGDLYLLVVRDANGDHRFTTDDPPTVYAWREGSAGPAEPLIRDDVLTSVRGWLQASPANAETP